MNIHITRIVQSCQYHPRNIERFSKLLLWRYNNKILCTHSQEAESIILTFCYTKYLNHQIKSCKEFKIQLTYHHKDKVKGACNASTEVIIRITSWKNSQLQDGQSFLHRHSQMCLRLLEIQRPSRALKSASTFTSRIIWGLYKLRQ